MSGSGRRNAAETAQAPGGTVIDTVAWLHLHDGRVLATRSAGKRLFYVPGGKRNPGESDLDTLVREAAEELTVTLDADSARHFGTYRAAADGHGVGVTVTMACYTAGFRGTPVASGEIAEVVWLSYADRDRTAPVDRLLFDDLRAAGLLL
ncbi:NUDIX domain-containing protein [Streptomyces sp. TRM 70351]|uniref:NUDIX hydrolase n=1 Tax=Streptomyces sp. TRM 70351 TaxID=3116552 RepID=UPI002E7B2D00|nr:NUDIX domain-containing protein [Streptomyces sp. TRM 70351]MEE1927226.1 NUDIX domain-containing protein [Streptomyces sp. TRM 70351]